MSMTKHNQVKIIDLLIDLMRGYPDNSDDILAIAETCNHIAEYGNDNNISSTDTGIIYSGLIYLRCLCSQSINAPTWLAQFQHLANPYRSGDDFDHIKTEHPDISHNSLAQAQIANHLVKIIDAVGNNVDWERKLDQLIVLMNENLGIVSSDKADKYKPTQTLLLLERYNYQKLYNLINQRNHSDEPEREQRLSKALRNLIKSTLYTPDPIKYVCSKTGQYRITGSILKLLRLFGLRRLKLSDINYHGTVNIDPDSWIHQLTIKGSEYALFQTDYYSGNGDAISAINNVYNIDPHYDISRSGFVIAPERQENDYYCQKNSSVTFQTSDMPYHNQYALIKMWQRV